MGSMLWHTIKTPGTAQWKHICSKHLLVTFRSFLPPGQTFTGCSLSNVSICCFSLSYLRTHLGRSLGFGFILGYCMYIFQCIEKSFFRSNDKAWSSKYKSAKPCTSGSWSIFHWEKSYILSVAYCCLFLKYCMSWNVWWKRRTDWEKAKGAIGERTGWKISQ